MTLGIGLLVLLAIVTFMNQKPPEDHTIDYWEFREHVTRGEVAEVEIQGQRIVGHLNSGQEFETTGSPSPEVLEQLLAENKVRVKWQPPPDTNWWGQILISWFPILLIIGLWFLVFRQLQSGGGKAMSFGKSRARLLNENQTRITFQDVAGIEEAKAELEEIVAFLRDPKKFTRLGGRIPKGVLLVGPPGTGKTLLARAIAGEAGVPFFSISGSDFVEMFVGVGASRVRDLFMQGKKNAPCIIFIDEIDAVGRHRGAGMGGGHDEREQTLNQMLVEMDGFESNEGVIIIAATNRPDVLDPAMLRPGRFDRHVVVPRPDLRGREAILRVHARKVLLADGVDLVSIARGTPGFSGADLENLCNEAALLAARRDADSVTLNDFEGAKDKIMMGTERRSMILSEEERRVIAFHESGHALVAMLEDDSDPVHKVSIIPRGMALGVTQTMPTEDRNIVTRKQLMARVVHAMGGRAAEDIVFDQFSTGAANDLQQATKTVREMICSYGMSEALGPVSWADDSSPVFLGRDFGHVRDRSEEKARQIDEEVTEMLTFSYERAKTLITENRAILDSMAEALLERETIGDLELKLLMEGADLPPLPAPETTPAVQTENAGAEDKAPRAPLGNKGVPDPEPIPG